MLLTQVTLTVRDAKNKPGQHRFFIDLDDPTWNTNDQILVDVVAYLQEVASRVDAIIRGAIVEISLTMSIPLPGGIRTSPELDSDVEEKAKLAYNQPGLAPFENTIPSFDHTLFPTGSTVLDPNSVADVSYLVQLLVNSTEALDWAGEYGGITNGRGEVLTVTPTVKKTFK